MKYLMLAFALMSSAVADAQEWRKDLDGAIAEAKSDGKRVFLLFSLPDACDACQRLEKNVVESETFIKFVNQGYVLARPDFSGSVSFDTNADNLLIVEKYNKDGFFPWVVILDPNAKVLAKMGQYNNETPEAYIGKLQAMLNK